MKKQALVFLMLLFVLTGFSAPGRASISDFRQLLIDFTSPSDAISKATWSDPATIVISKAGLGWESDPSSSLEGWILTNPFSLGFSWRPTISASIKVSLQPPLKSFTLANGQVSQPWRGQLYVRYSPDCKNWSTWQALQADDELIRKKQEVVFKGFIQVSNRDREEYTKLLSEYTRMDVPWKSDEEATVRWILSKDPKFFEKNIPFIAYIQFLYETGFHGGQRIARFSADIGYGMSGMHYAPKDTTHPPDEQKTWSYKAP